MSAPIVVIAGVASGVGKTTVTMHFASNPGLARAFVAACAR
jgi:2-phosphoglycerate kinase